MQNERLMELYEIRDLLDSARKEFEENYSDLEDEIAELRENECGCDCENCEYEKLVDCNIKDELGILIEEDDGEIYITLQDLDNGDIITITEEQLHAIVKLFNCVCE